MKITIAELNLVCVSLIVLRLILTGQSYARIEPKTAVGIWLFDDGTGDTAKDSSPNGNDGKFKNNPKWVEGQFGKALEFDGASDYVDCGKDKSLDVIDEITIMAWVNIKGDGISNGIIFLKQEPTGTPGASYGLVYLVGPDKLSFSLETVNNPWADYPIDETVKNNTWYHVVGTYEQGELKVYLDGELKTEAVPTGKIDPTPGPIHIGQEDAWAQEQFKGIIDELAIFDVVLTKDEIKNLMEGGLGRALAVSPSGKLTTTWATVKVRHQ